MLCWIFCFDEVLCILWLLPLLCLLCCRSAPAYVTPGERDYNLHTGVHEAGWQLCTAPQASRCIICCPGYLLTLPPPDSLPIQLQGTRRSLCTAGHAPAIGVLAGVVVAAAAVVVVVVAAVVLFVGYVLPHSAGGLAADFLATFRRPPLAALLPPPPLAALLSPPPLPPTRFMSLSRSS